MANAQPQKINKITVQEIILLYGYTLPGAERKIKSIRASLEKKRCQLLSVTEFCRYEGITLDDFDIMIQRSLGK